MRKHRQNTVWHKLQQDPFWPPRVMNIKTNKWDIIKLKDSHSKESHKQNENTTLRMGENICQWSNWQGLFSKIYKQFMQLNIKNKQTNKKPNKKREEGLNKLFSKEDIQIANRHTKRCSTSLFTRETQIKTTMRFHFTPVRMAAI